MAAVEREFVNAFVDGQELVKLFREPRDGKVYATRQPAEYSAFLRRGEAEAAEYEGNGRPGSLLRELRSSAVIRGIRVEGEYVRVSWTSWEARKGYIEHPNSPLVTAGLDVLEGDVDPVRRHFSDTGARIGKPRRCYLDIETDSRVPFSKKEEMRLLTWAVVCHDTGRVWNGCLSEDTDKAERELLSSLWATLQSFDQVCGWYLDGFDAPVLFARSRRQKASVDARRWLWADQLVVVQSFHHGGDGEDKRSMRLEDVGQALTGRGKLKAPDWVTERFGDRSMGALSWDLWAAGGRFRELLVEYNVKDTELLRHIEQRTGYLNLFDAVCRVCRLFAETNSLQNTRQMDGYMLTLGRERGYRFPTRRYAASVKFKGAFVMKPATLDAAWRAKHRMTDGITRDVHVCDFSSMYPSIILSWNMSPDTKVYGPPNGPVPGGMCRSPLTGVCFENEEEGILPHAIRELSKLRKHWNDLKATLSPGSEAWEEAGHLSQAYKVVVLAFYGVVGSVFSRFFDRSIAESITQAGVWLIRQTMHEAEKRGWAVMYADTDSLFVTGVGRDEFAGFVRWCNEDLYPRLLAGQGCRANEVRLAYEKQFERLVMTSKKRYVGRMRHYKWTTSCTCDVAEEGGKTRPGAFDLKTMRCRDCGAAREDLPPLRGAPEIKGLEFNRGDALEMASDMQADVMDLLVGGMGRVDNVPTVDIERYHGYLSRIRQRVLEEPLALRDVRMSKALSRPLKEYAKKKKKDGDDASQPPHVTVAHVLKARGQDVGEGTRIEYFVEDGAASPMKVVPAEDWKGECDRYYLWESLVFPPTLRLLQAAFPESGWGEWEKVRPRRETQAQEVARLQTGLFEEAKPVQSRRKKSAAGQGGLFDGLPAQRKKASPPV